MSLKEFDNKPVDDDDQYETPGELYESLCKEYDIFPRLDVCANKNNTKCDLFLEDALHVNWFYDTWCNPPHSKTEEFVKRARTQHLEHNINILMIVPANSICASYFDGVFDRHVDYYRISGRPQFLRDGKKSRFPSRNSYFAVVWRKK